LLVSLFLFSSLFRSFPCFPTSEVPAKVVWLRLVEALSHSSSLETLKLIFAGKYRSAGSDDGSDAADQLAALPSLLSACGPQLRKVGLYCVPEPLRQQIDATMAAYPSASRLCSANPQPQTRWSREHILGL
jgi:hypothetical protein